jgi:hypothetical protein
MQKYVNDIATVVGGSLAPLASASCAVYLTGTTTLASLYSDNGVTALTNPTTSSATGRLQFYAADGRYDIVCSKSGYTTTTITDVLLEDPANAGDLLYLPNGTGAVTRTIQGKLRETVSVTDFGAVGDGVTDDTAAIQAALAAGQAQSKSIYFPAGTYSVSTLLMPLNSYLNPFGLIGEGPGVTKIQKRSSDGLALFTVGSTAATAFSTQLWIQGITFSGIAANTPAAVQLYDLVRSTFQQCVFQNSIAGCISSGGITNTYQNCIFKNNQIGIKFDKFISLAGGGYPNNNSLKNCGIFDNSLQGIYFNNGRNLYISDCDIEGNGTSGNSSTMGIYVANVNNENSGAAPAIGVSMLNCWLEANAGDAALQINSGVNTVRSCYFATNANATNDIHIVGGNYHLNEIAFGTNKVANLLESAGSSTGNSIVNSYDALVGNFSYDAAKTFIQGTWNSGSGVLKHTLLMRSGSVPVVMSTVNPMIQTGTATTGGAGTVNVTFATAFASAPLVYASIVDASSTRTSGVQLSSISTTGFSILATYLQSGSSTVNVYASTTVYWVAIGATS